MQITNFSISADRTQIDVTITNASNVSALRFWTDSTYKDYSKAIDLTSKLTNSATENIIITLSDLNISYFDGVYFLEAEDNLEVSSAITSDLTRYNECLINKVAEFSVCEDCAKENSNLINNIHITIDSLNKAINNSFINEILLFVETLNKYCSNDCLTCGNFDNIKDTNYYNTND